MEVIFDNPYEYLSAIITHEEDFTKISNSNPNHFNTLVLIYDKAVIDEHISLISTNKLTHYGEYQTTIG